MDRWEVRSDSKVVIGEGPNWLLAVGSSAHQLGLDPKSLRRLVCVIENDGLVRIRDPKTGVRLTVRRLTTGGAELPSSLAKPMGAPAPRVMASAPSEEPDTSEADELERTLDEVLPGSLPDLTMLVPHLPAGDSIDASRPEPSGVPGPGDAAPEDLVETLFELGMDISGAPDVESASLKALEILSRYIPVESSAVLVVDPQRNALRFTAATGPHADRAKSVYVPLGLGIAGFAVSSGGSLIVQDAESDPRRYAEVDDVTGYTTRSMLCAVLVDGDGTVLGCIELINPWAPFVDWHLDAACTVAASLAEAVSIHGPAPATE